GGGERRGTGSCPRSGGGGRRRARSPTPPPPPPPPATPGASPSPPPIPSPPGGPGRPSSSSRRSSASAIRAGWPTTRRWPGPAAAWRCPTERTVGHEIGRASCRERGEAEGGGERRAGERYE